MGEGMTVGEKFDQIRNEGLENAFERYYSLYPGKVVDDCDEQQQGRACVKVRFLGFNENHPAPAYPISPYAGENFGFYFPPHKDAPVLVAFDNGDVNAPNYLGSWWPNKDKQSTPRSPSKSHVPAEFVKSDGSSPTARGIKTKKGHGIIFEGEEEKAYVELWSGENQAVGSPAEKHHRVRLDDTKDSEEIVIASFGGHSTTWRDKAGDVFVKTATAGGHEILMSDKDSEKRILIKTTDGNQILLDDSGQKIQAKTKGGHTVEMSDTTKKVSVTTTGFHTLELDDNAQHIQMKTKGLRTMLMSDLTQTITTQNVPGQTVTIAPAGTTVADPGLVTVTAGGALALTGTGVTMTSAAGGPSVQNASGITNNNFQGLKTDTLLGGYVAAIPLGLWSIIGASLISLGGLIVQLGSGTQFRLVTEEFFTAYNGHVHNTTAPGAPTGPVIIGQGIPGAHTTIQTTAS